jgi:HlyD family secretion protein
MDIPRKSEARKRRIRRIIYGVLGLAAIGGITLGLSRLERAVPPVDRNTVLIDTVKRGLMLRNVRGMGTLVPEEIRWVPAVTNGRVERRLVQPGAVVRADTVLLELSNPQLEQETLNAEWDWKAAESSYQDLEVKLESDRLNQEAETARIVAEYNQATLRAEANSELAKQGLVPELTLKLERVTAEQLASRIDIEKKRLEKSRESIDAQLAVQKTRVQQQRAIYELKRSQLDQLKVRAGVPGILQSLLAEVGQSVIPGTNLARVSNPARLKAELKVPETQVKDVAPGQEATVDTHNGIIQGRVSRIDPAAQEGSVKVDVTLTGELPPGARPDLSVDGIIELERLTDVVYVQRPVQGQANSLVGLFKLEPDGQHASRVQVKLGRIAVTTVEIIEGLKPGDQVILSDMTAQDAHDRVQLY